MITRGRSFEWPDFVHFDYGFPFTFATHTTSTLAGAVDLWSLDMGSLAGDFLFWTAGTIAILLGFVYLARREARADAVHRA